jgi:hypothetical protein
MAATVVFIPLSTCPCVRVYVHLLNVDVMRGISSHFKSVFVMPFFTSNVNATPPPHPIVGSLYPPRQPEFQVKEGRGPWQLGGYFFCFSKGAERNALATSGSTSFLSLSQLLFRYIAAAQCLCFSETQWLLLRGSLSHPHIYRPTQAKKQKKSYIAFILLLSTPLNGVVASKALTLCCLNSALH